MRWVWIIGPWRRVLAFAYSDARGAPAARGCDVTERDALARAIERPDSALPETGDRVDPLDPETIAQLGLPARPPWLEAATATHPWREDPALAGRLHDDFPDDVQVRFYLTPHHGEDMWVSTRDVDLAIGGYVGELLNTPELEGTGLRDGSVVSYRAVRADTRPLWVSTRMRAEHAEWSSVCPECGLDFLVQPVASVLGPAFAVASRGRPHVVLGVGCIVCEAPIVIKRRQDVA